MEEERTAFFTESSVRTPKHRKIIGMFRAQKTRLAVADAKAVLTFPSFKMDETPQTPIIKVVERASKEELELLKDMKEAVALKSAIFVLESEDYCESAQERLQSELESVRRVRKKEVFKSKFSKSEQQVIELRKKVHQRHVRNELEVVIYMNTKVVEAERRRAKESVQRLRSGAAYLSVEEAGRILNKNRWDEEHSLFLLSTEYSYLDEIREEIAKGTQENRDSEGYVHQPPKVRRARRRIAKTNKTLLAEQRELQKTYRYKRLRLDDALKDTVSFQGWSPARVRAFKAIDTNPNAYYYRFNAPGKEQRNGAFSPEEKIAFLRRKDEVGVDGQWGVFSMAMPGRVGYQCSNFYRKLIESGEIHDPNYVLDETGRARYLFKGRRIISRKKRPDGTLSTPTRVKKQKRVRAPRYRASFHGSDDEEEDEVDGDYVYRPTAHTTRIPRKASCGVSASSPAVLISSDTPYENPLPKSIDPVTLCEMEMPTISPTGHVMDYNSWCEALAVSGGVCPMTRTKLDRSQLVVLTKDNIEQYRSKIVHST